ncbi:hypothetical protein GH5_06261 [Leishmania sp. Ghana 2012 LV757]|uniref:hypothetical protein n=1 Tax=Leishmania sp. Ghana 2012 LV757 TaxID=2803181 RepID=UPI001B4CA37D|nr:hypothetical protein GH5_06261 [Leishmania sp. Ghana 2012 LV757]
MPKLSDPMHPQHRELVERRLSVEAEALQSLRRVRHILFRLFSSEIDAMRFARFLCSTLLLALILALMIAAAALWPLEVPYCRYVSNPIESAQLAALGWREPLPQRSAGKRCHANTDLENRVNEYLAEHNGTDGRQLLPARIHFIVVTNQTGWSFCMVAASCALAGVRLSVLGVDTPYSHVWRFEKYLDYLEREGLRDEDIVITLDTDVAWTGSDVLYFLQKFARYSPASEAALDLAAVRAWEDYGEEVGSAYMATLRTTPGRPSRPLLQLPPVIFNADDDCYFHQPVKGLFQCFTSDYVTTHLVAAARNGASFFSAEDAARASSEDWNYFKKIYNSTLAGRRAHRLLNTPLEAATFLRTPDDPFFYEGAFSVGRNPAHYLNAGMHISRAWALRELSVGVLRFAKERQPRDNREWFCDQSIIGMLRYNLRMFEINEGLLFGTGHRKDGGLFRDPFGLPVGLISVDQRTQFMFTSHLRRRKGLGDLIPYYTRHRDDVSLTALDSHLIATRSGAFVAPPLWGREVQPRCLDVPLPDGSVSARCSAVPRQLSHPCFMHFAAGSKRQLYLEYREWFTWYFAAQHSIKARLSSMQVLSNLELELWRTSMVQHIPFFAVCPSPFHGG